MSRRWTRLAVETRLAEGWRSLVKRSPQQMSQRRGWTRLA
jgi:hypothetical protein